MCSHFSTRRSEWRCATGGFEAPANFGRGEAGHFGAPCIREERGLCRTRNAGAADLWQRSPWRIPVHAQVGENPRAASDCSPLTGPNGVSEGQLRARSRRDRESKNGGLVYFVGVVSCSCSGTEVTWPGRTSMVPEASRSRME